MGVINFINHDGKQHVVELEVGKSLMQIAMDNGVSGIDADCGGACACGTCHIVVDTKWINAAGSVMDDELQMLEMKTKKKPTSRLSCQIKASESMDGMIVHVPEFQM